MKKIHYKISGPLRINKRFDPERINEDYMNFKKYPEKGRAFCIIADGVGGEKGGSTASKMAVDIVSGKLDYILKKPQSRAFVDYEDFQSKIEEIIQYASNVIYETSSSNPELTGMATTIALAVLDKAVYLAHAGDTRIYLLKKDRSLLCTKDHTFTHHLLFQNALKEAQAFIHRDANNLTSWLGRETGVDVRYFNCSADSIDSILIATDGVTKFFFNDALKKILAENEEDEALKKIGESIKNPSPEIINAYRKKYEDFSDKEIIDAISDDATAVLINFYCNTDGGALNGP